MLWRFSFASASTVDSLLSRETPPSVEELLEEPDILAEVKAQNNKLVSYVSKEDTARSLLSWVTSGLSELDQEAQEADTASYEHVLADPSLYPSYHPRPSPTAAAATTASVRVPGPGPGSPPLEPARIPEPPEISPRANLSGSYDAGFAGGQGQFGGSGNGQNQDEDAKRAKYPQTATEILTSELWVVPETIMSHKETLLRPFWDAVLPPLPRPAAGESPMSRQEEGERIRARDEFWSEEDEERDRKREVIRGHWVRVNGSLLAKRTTEMIRFIQSLPDIVPRMLAQISSPSVQELLIRIIQAEEGGVPGVIKWLSSEGLVPSLLAMLSPHYPPTTHAIACELLKSIITLCAPVPFNPAGGNAMEPQPGQVGQSAGTRDNRLVRELVSEQSVKTLVGFMLDPVELSDADWKGSDGSGTFSPADIYVQHPLPNLASATSSVAHICNVFTELIRRNNSDFSEPHLFHTLRNRLMSIRSHQAMAPSNAMAGEGEGEGDSAADAEDENRIVMEKAMTELTDKMGIVHLGHLLTVLCDRFDELHNLLLNPRSQARNASAARKEPLTVERFRIIELYAELLHSSNMSIMNRAAGMGPSYSADGILLGGLEGLEKLSDAIDGTTGGADAADDDDDGSEERVTQARELPVSSGSTDASLESADVSIDDERSLEDIEDEATPAQTQKDSGSPESPARPESEATDNSPAPEADASANEAGTSGPASSAASDGSTTTPRAEAEPESLSAGDRLKAKFLEYRVVPILVDFFFQYPQNDFMHHTVYDVIQQILNGWLGPSRNKELAMELVMGSRLIDKVREASNANDRAVAAGHARAAYMGHLGLIGVELVKFLGKCSNEAFDQIQGAYDLEAWDAYVDGSLKESKMNDALPLAGGKPLPGTAAAGGSGGAGGGDAAGDDSSDEDDEDTEHKFGEPLARVSAQQGFADRGGDSPEDEEGGVEQYWRKVGQEAGRRQIDSSDEDDDDADWLRPNLAARGRRESSDDEFGAFHAPAQARGTSGHGDPDDFDDDDAWGTFNSASPSRSPGVHRGDDDDPENPFGDDNFVPSVPPLEGSSRSGPLTPMDWASEFDREFAAGEPSSWSTQGFGGDDDDDTGVIDGNGVDGGADEADDGAPAIVMPRMERDEDDETAAGGLPPLPDTPGSHWSFTGTDEDGEDLPPTLSPQMGGDVEVMRDEKGLAEALHSVDIRDTAAAEAPIGLGAPITLGGSSSAVPVPARQGSVHSPGEESLVLATSPDAPLGPGVSPDTEITEEGMLQKVVDGEVVQVPADEIVMGVEEHQGGAAAPAAAGHAGPRRSSTGQAGAAAPAAADSK